MGFFTFVLSLMFTLFLIYKLDLKINLTQKIFNIMPGQKKWRKYVFIGFYVITSLVLVVNLGDKISEDIKPIFMGILVGISNIIINMQGMDKK